MDFQERKRKQNYFEGSCAIDLEKFEEYLDKKDYSQCTKEIYKCGILDYLKHGFNEVSFQNISTYRSKLMAENKKGRTINTRMSALTAYNRMVGFPQVDGVDINEDPFAVNAMEIDDFHELIDNLLKDGNYQWYVIVKFLASTGLRIQEACSVTVKDLKNGYATVFGKGRKMRTVYFSHNLQESLFIYIKEMKDEDKIIPFDPHQCRNRLGYYKNKYHIKCKTSPHEYRRFFAREMYENTHDLALIKGLLGHASVNTTSHYIKKTQKEAMRMYSRSQTW